MEKEENETRKPSMQSLRFTSNYAEGNPPEWAHHGSNRSQLLNNTQARTTQKLQTERSHEPVFGPSFPDPTIRAQDPVLQHRLLQANTRRNAAPAIVFTDQYWVYKAPSPFKSNHSHRATLSPSLLKPSPYKHRDRHAAPVDVLALSRTQKSSLKTSGALSTSRGSTVYKTQLLQGPTVYDPTTVSHNQFPNAAAQEEDLEETKDEFKTRLTYLLKQMMFVSGETAESSTETTWMIEEIVREQVVEMLKEATILANRRGSKSIAIVDLIFQIRHNTAKVSRLKTFLSWKDVRKNVKDSDDKAGGADADALDLDDAAVPGANPSAPQKSSTNKKAKLILPWEVQSFYSEQVPEREDEEDEEEEEQNEATLARLASADERTRNMTREEYVYWSECRQASFTFRKGKRFKEWAGFGTVIDSKPNDDVVDILGFLTFEIVQTLTEEALKVKAAEDLANKKANGGRGDVEATKKRKREGCTLFEMPEEGRTPVEPKHVREAFRRLQIVPPKYKAMRQGYAGIRTPLRMI